MKKTISLMMALLMTLSVLFTVNLNAFAESGIDDESSTPVTSLDGNYEYYLSNEKAVITKYLGSETKVIVPVYLDGNEVAEIGDKAFFRNTEITDVSLPDSVVKIGESAFHDCFSLATIDLGEGVTTIGKNAFYNCFYLESLSLPASVSEIGENAFKDTERLSSITVAAENPYFVAVDNVLFTKDMSALLLYGAKGNNTYVVPDGVMAIADGAFFASKVKDITFPASLVLIDKDAFEGNVLETVRYKGSEADWKNKVEINNENGGNKILVSDQVEFVFSEEHEHVAGEAERENEAAATCEAEGSYDEVVYCTVCGEELSRETKAIEALGHDMGEWQSAGEGVPATCTTDGVDGSEIRTCSRCDYIETRGGEVIPALGHDFVAGEVVAPTCTEAGYTVYNCSRCDATENRDEVPASGHIPAEAVKETEVAATCKDEGSYDEVVYCSVCGAEISRETKTTEKLDTHTPAAAVKENVKAATCKANGSYDEVVYCSVCGEELSRNTVVTEKTDHSPKAAVKEKEIKATYTKGGSYDLVVYCSICGEELSREPKTTPKLEGKNGWYKINGYWYLYKDNVMQKYWHKVNGRWYYMNSKGIMITGWLKIKGVWYHFGTGGAMADDWRYINNKWYYFNKDGAMQTGWLKQAGKWYYLNASGDMAVGKQTINGKVYTFDYHGVCQNP